MGKVVSLYGGKDPRELPTHAVGEAAVYLGVPRSTLATWVRGQRVHGKTRMHRLIDIDRAAGLLSFNNLAEAYVLASLTRRYADVIVENQVVIELKVVAKILAAHRQQLLTYLRATGLRLGLIMNFNAPVLWREIKRVVL